MSINVNANIPEDLSNELEQYCQYSGYNKQQIIIVAISQFLEVKKQEREFKEDNPNRKVKSRIVLETQPLEDDRQRLASVLLY